MSRSLKKNIARRSASAAASGTVSTALLSAHRLGQAHGELVGGHGRGEVQVQPLTDYSADGNGHGVEAWWRLPGREVLHTSLLDPGASQPAAQATFSSSWTWAALIGVIAIAVTIGIAVIQLRKRRIERQADELKPLHELLCSTLLLLDDLEKTEATKEDLAGLLEKRSRIGHAAEAWPKIPLIEIATRITAYEAAALPDNFLRMRLRKDQVGKLFEFSRKQGAAIAELRAAIKTAKHVIEHLRSR